MTENSLTTNNNNNSNDSNANSNDNEKHNETHETTATTAAIATPSEPKSPRSILKVKIPPPLTVAEHETANNKNGKSANGKHKKKRKKKHRDKSDLGDDFVAPDGGWGWLVSVAAGVNTLVIFAIAQQFGIIFRSHMNKLGISSAQLTTIINTQIAVSAFTGLVNGPMFRRFTFRQVAFVGAILSFAGIFMSVFARTFLVYMMSFSIMYGLGRGLAVSASSLAVNTYFKEKRRTATSYQFGVAAIGPIVCPYIATYLLIYYGVEGTVLLFAAASLHTIACALIFQPVQWHVKKKKSDDAEANAKIENTPRTMEDELVVMAEPETPLMPRAADGWYGSRLSLNTPTEERARLGSFSGSHRGSIVEMQELKRRNSSKETVSGKPRTFSASHSIKEEDDELENGQRENLLSQRNVEMMNMLSAVQLEDDEKAALKAKTKEELQRGLEEDHEERKKLPLWKKIVVFFDFDLLRDFGYMNLAIGITLINFAEINFAILTPFILDDFGFNAAEIAMAMSLLGFCDLVIRFLVPPITAKFNYSNKTFFIIGIAGMCFGRLLLAFTRNFYVMLAIFLWLGLNKAFRTIFWNLILPGYVPLKRLPAAAGLQLLMSGIFSMACGPIIGLIRDQTNYGFTLQFLNAICIFAIAMWLIESWITERRAKSEDNKVIEAH